MDVRVAVPVLIIPNIVMDGIQAARWGGWLGIVRRMAVLLAFGVVGMFLGTRLLVVLPARVAVLAIGVVVLTFVAVNLTRRPPRIPPEWTPWLAPPLGLVAGVLGGVANIPGLPLVIYFYSLRMPKAEFVQSVAVVFVCYKLIQLAAVTWHGLMTWPLVGGSLGLTAVGLGAFRLGLAVQDRLAPAAFNRLVLAFLALLGLGLVGRAVR
jgi:uncharacterized membrane protein YfcA